MKNEAIEEVLERSQILLELTKDIFKDDQVDISRPQKMYEITSSGNFIQLPQDSFMMGSNRQNDESPQHKVSIDYNLAICKYQVTVKEYMEFAESTNSNYPEWVNNKSNSRTVTMSHYKNTNLNDDAPIIGISWENAKAYCEWLSQKEGRTYRLPTEAEWEYACRAGSITRYCFGDNESYLKKYAWHNENSNKRTHSVGTKLENLWGIYDMHGNVWEWCEDVWISNYETTPRDGSANKIGNPSVRVLRGGSWVDSPRYVRSSNRNGYDIDGCDNDIGFRVVLEGILN